MSGVHCFWGKGSLQMTRHAYTTATVPTAQSILHLFTVPPSILARADEVIE